MSENKNPKRYDLEDRTFEFAQNVRTLPQTVSNMEDVRQVVRSSGSVGANYIEANESVSKKDMLLRMKTSRKEAKESRYWLRLLFTGGKPKIESNREGLIQEATELMNILSAIIRKCE